MPIIALLEDEPTTGKKSQNKKIIIKNTWKFIKKQGKIKIKIKKIETKK